MMTATATVATTTHGVIDRVHGNTTYRGADTAPASSASLTDDTQTMLFVTHFADGGAAFNVHTAYFT